MAQLDPSAASGVIGDSHAAEPIDGCFRFREDIFGLGGHVFCAEGEFEQNSSSGTFNGMEDHPPEGAAMENCVVGFVGDDLEDGAGRGDAFVCRDVVEVVGMGRLVCDSAVKAAEARAIDDGAGAVGKNRQGNTIGFGFGVLRWMFDVKGSRKGGIELKKFTVKLLDSALDFRPFHVTNRGTVKSS